MAELLASAAVMWVNHTRAVQIPRWYGYMRNHPVERHVRGVARSLRPNRQSHGGSG